MLRAPALMLALSLLILGCSSDDGSGTKQTPTADAADTPDASNEAKRQAQPSAEQISGRMVKAARRQIAEDELDEAEKTIAKLKRLQSEAKGQKQSFQARISQLEEELAQRRQALAEKHRQELSSQRARKLEEARDFLDAGQLDEAKRALDYVLGRAPTDEERQTAGTLWREIERRRSAQRKLGSLIKMLGSTKRADVRSAQMQLARDPDVALPLLFEAVRNTDNPQLVANTLELLARLRRPEITLPQMVGVLERVKQKSNWPDAVREISQVDKPGAGELLLELVRSSQVPAQRTAALKALARVVDPPAGTLVTLLPLIHADGPELAAALKAAHNAIRVHRQYDLVARRGFQTPLSIEGERQLTALPARLLEILRSSEQEGKSETAHAARALAIAVGVMVPEPIGNVQVASVIAEAEDGPAAALLDGVWNSTDLKTMWRYPAGREGAVVLDLGAVRTVVGVRIWNFNQPGGQHRGWKEVHVYVSDSKTALVPAARGIVPAAPGAAETPDYSTLIPVDFARGRYVKLEEKSVWRPDSYKGLSEVQILGF